MNPRLIYFVLGAVIAGLLFLNAASVVVLWRQRAEIESLRAQLASQQTGGQRVSDGEQQNDLAQADRALAEARAARDEEVFDNQRKNFLQSNFAGFQSITFQPATNSEAVIQRLKVSTHMVTFQGRRYTGFRFTVPEWMDGDFEWMYFHLTNEQNKNRRVRAEWYIIPERGRMERGFDDFDFKPLTTYPLLKKRFPNSREACRQTLRRDRLNPGESYAIWFGYLDSSNVPDIAVALTINSERGHREFGTLPLK